MITEEEVHQQYVSREERFKTFGYDITKERRWVVETAGPLEGEILEVGTGKGNLTLALLQQGYRLTSVDVCEEDQLLARLHIRYHGLEGNVRFIAQDARRMGFNDGAFDVLFAVNLVHHLSDPYAVVDEMVRVTAKGGRIILSDFSDQGFDVIERIHRSEGRSHPRGERSLDEVKQYLQEKGLDVEEKQAPLQTMLLVRIPFSGPGAL